MQKTIKKQIQLTGIGVHSGAEVNLKLLPAEANTGVLFKRTDLGKDAIVPASYKYVESTQACTKLVNDKASVATVEHLLSACAGMGVDNLMVEVDGPEMPIMDGSSLVFAEAIKAVGLLEQNSERNYLQIDKEIKVELEDKYIILRPYNGFKIEWTVIYDYPYFTAENSTFTYDAEQDDYLAVCAPARTYGFLHEYEYLLKNNLARGASMENVLVLDGDKVVNPEGARFANECVRHKVLDFIGDIFLLGRPIKAEVIVQKSGHTLNAKLVEELVVTYGASA